MRSHPYKQNRKEHSKYIGASWKSKVNSITEVENLETRTINDLIGNSKTYKLTKYQNFKIVEFYKDKKLVFEAIENLETDDDDMELLTRRFQRMIKKRWIQEEE